MMDTLPDLTMATRAELLAVIAAQQRTIAVLQERIGALEERLGPRGKGMPGLKPAASTRSKAGSKPRKRRAQAFVRRRMAPTRTVTHAPAACPDCGTALRGGWIKRRREVLELPAVPVEVVEHRFLARTCPLCRRAVVAPAADLGDAVVGKQRLGPRLTSLIVTLREEGRLPVQVIRWYLGAVHRLRLSVGAIVRLCHQVAARGQGTLAQIREAVRASPLVHVDETGWRQTGVNGYVWTFTTPSERYFLRDTREGRVVDEVLGETFAGVLLSDFYAGYHHYPGRKQRCWTHLLRDIHDLTVAYPHDTGLHDWATAVKETYAEAVAARSDDPAVRRQAKQRFEARLLDRCRPFLDDPLAVQRTLCRRIERHIDELFVFVSDPVVPPDNNAAERSLRHLVTIRKISGGTRADRGTATRMANASLFGTWRARGLDPLTACHALLLAPHP